MRRGLLVLLVERQARAGAVGPRPSAILAMRQGGFVVQAKVLNVMEYRRAVIGEIECSQSRRASPDNR